LKIAEIQTAVGDYHKTQMDSLHSLMKEIRCLAPKHKYMTKIIIVIIALGTFKLFELIWMAALAIGITELWNWFIKVMLL
jgi:hypothetical protein